MFQLQVGARDCITDKNLLCAPARTERCAGDAEWARALARESEGSSRAARMPMMAMTTSSSMSVNPAAPAEGWRWSGIALLSAVFMAGFNHKSGFHCYDQFWSLKRAAKELAGVEHPGVARGRIRSRPPSSGLLWAETPH
jgi:hypothetical protein